MKKRILSSVLSLILLTLFIPCGCYTEGEDDAFVTVSIDCPEAKQLEEEDYQAYSHLLMRYADDKTPIALSDLNGDTLYATIPAENKGRPLEYFVSEELTFTDKPSWDEDNYSDNSFYFYIMERLSAKGVVKGNDKGEALPFDNVTRAEAVAMAMRLLGVDNMQNTDSGFSDVAPDSWYAAAVTKARELGIVYGDDETHFSPMRNVSHEEMVALAARCFWISGHQKDMPTDRSALIEKHSLVDGDEIADWALSAYSSMRCLGALDYDFEYYDDPDKYAAFARPKDAASRYFSAYVLLEGCESLQIYPSKEAIAYGFDKTMPKIDGSTSTYPFTEAVYSSLFSNGLNSPDKPQKHSKSHASYERLINGEVDMLFASVYPASDILELAKEKGVELELIPIAYDAMIFFTNIDNPAEGLTKKQISEIYVDNKYKTWKELGGNDALLYPYCRNNDSGSHAQMERHFLNGKEINEEIRKENTSEAMENILTDVMGAETYNPEGYGLGYSIYYYFQNMDLFYDTNDYLKLLEIDGVYPDDDTIASGEYPLSNNTYLVLRKDEPKNSPARKMAEFMLTKAGQACVEEAGFGALYPTNPQDLKAKRTSEYDSIFAKNGDEVIYYTVRYPVLSKKEKSKAVDSLNKEIKEIKEDFITAVKDMTDGIVEFYEQIEDPDEKDFFPYDCHMSYDITRNTGGIFSMYFTQVFYTGGAHPFGGRIALNYDTETGKELTLTEILKKSQDEVNKLVIEKFYEEYEDEDLWDLEEEAPEVSFYIDGDNLVLFFQQYQIAPYAMGFPEVRVPLDEIE